MGDLERVELLTTDDASPKKLPKEFSYTKYTFGEYESAWGNGNVSIYAVSNKDEKEKGISQRIICEDYNLLCSILSLRKELRSVFESAMPIEDKRVTKSRKYRTINIDIPENVLNTGTNLNPSAIEAIKKWCIRYGYPFAFDVDKYNNTKQQLLLFGHKGHIPAGFMLSDFLIHLNEVYYAFQLCRVITGNLQPKSLIGEVTLTFPTDYRLLSNKQFEDIHNLTPSRCMEIFSKKYAERYYKSTISFDKKNHAHIQVHAESPFDAAFYQLALFLNESKLEIRECVLCGQYFEVKDAREKYCKYENEFGTRTCYAQKVYKRRKLSEMKQRTSE